MAWASIRATTSPFFTIAPERARYIKTMPRAPPPRIRGAEMAAKFLAVVEPVRRSTLWIGPRPTLTVWIRGRLRYVWQAAPAWKETR